MGKRHHYVSQFHLRGFTDLASSTPNPWLWVGDRQTFVVRRRAPKNLAWESNLFAGPAGLSDRDSQLETFLATDVEGPAAFALRRFLAIPQGRRGSLPSEIGRYLAWAAARSISMKALFESWIARLPTINETQSYASFADSPFEREHVMKHPEHGVRHDVLSRNIEEFRHAGWKLLVTDDDFLQLVHLQAWQFETRFFPKLKWIVLDAPEGDFFVIGDRPVVWVFRELFDLEPRYLQHPNVQLFAPLSRSVAMFAFHTEAVCPSSVSPRDVNLALASAATEWVAGPTEAVVSNALSGAAA